MYYYIHVHVHVCISNEQTSHCTVQSIPAMNRQTSILSNNEGTDQYTIHCEQYTIHNEQTNQYTEYTQTSILSNNEYTLAI